MHCRTCQYALWNLRTRECPECGAAFLPSEFEFTPNAVGYHCPHCDQVYFGQDLRGHLMPREFECTSCGQHIAMDEMILRPAEGVDEAVTSRHRNPWFEREQRGTVRAWFATIGAAMTRPRSLVRGVPHATSMGRAWTFMFLSNLLFLIPGLVVPALAAIVLFGTLAGTGQAPGPPMGGFMMYQVVGQITANVASLALLTPVWVGLTHLILTITGQTEHLRRTAHAICYASAANVLTAVPCDCVGYAGTIWWIVAACLAVQAAHECAGWRATLAVLVGGIVPFVIRFALILGASLAPMGIPALGGGMPFTGQSETSAIVVAVSTYAAANQGLGPDHGVQLIGDGHVVPGAFISVGTATDGQRIAFVTPNSRTVLADFHMLPTNRRRMTADAVAATLPPDVVAHRVGDFVFVHHGIDLNAPTPGLWMLLLVPDPDANGSPGPATPVFIGMADSTVQQTNYASLGAQLRVQNALRAGLRLAPLPDPATVTHAAPATGTGTAPAAAPATPTPVPAPEAGAETTATNGERDGGP